MNQVDEILAADPPFSPGETRRYNHKGCGDTRGRLYVTLKLGSATYRYVAYCHNCGLPEFPTVGARPILTSGAPPSERELVSLPLDCEPMADAPSLARNWFAQYFCDASDTPAKWSSTEQRIILPVFNQGETHIRGYQARRVGSYGPKYLSAKGPAAFEMIFQQKNEYRNQLILTEDWLSAYRCTTVPGYGGTAAAPLLGLHFRPEFLKQCIDSCPYITVWLDNDAAAVKPREHVTAYLWVLGAKGVRVVHDVPEPKRHSPVELAQIFAAAHKYKLS